MMVTNYPFVLCFSLASLLLIAFWWQEAHEVAQMQQEFSNVTWRCVVMYTHSILLLYLELKYHGLASFACHIFWGPIYQYVCI